MRCASTSARPELGPKSERDESWLAPAAGAALLAGVACGEPVTAPLRRALRGPGQPRPGSRSATMAHANQLFTLNATGEPIPASSEDIIAAAREHLSRRLRRGTSLSSPQAVRDYLAVRLGAREFESFCCLFLDLCVPQNNVEPGDLPLLFPGFRASQLHITTAVRSGVTS